MTERQETTLSVTASEWALGKLHQNNLEGLGCWERWFNGASWWGDAQRSQPGAGYVPPAHTCTCKPQQMRNWTIKKAGLRSGCHMGRGWVLVLRGTQKPGVCPWARVQVLHACSERHTESDAEWGTCLGWVHQGPNRLWVPLTVPVL